MRAMCFALLFLGACTDGVGTGPGADQGATTDGGDVTSCENVVCNTPPTKTCESAQTLRVYDANGTCTDGVCSYTSTPTPCAQGCQSDACVGDPCRGVLCNQPAANTCADAFTLDVVNPAGTCSGGACSYGSTQITCAFGCAAGQCTGDPCAGKSCSAPPASYCADSNTLRSFAPSGMCAGGSCTYAPSSVTCQFGCAGGACTADPCAGKSCASPPPTFCVDPSTLRTFASSGVCAGGSCTYAPSDTVCAFGCAGAACKADPCLHTTCNAAPQPSCVNGAARVFSSAGVCNGGSCTYGYVDTPCANGCTAGACNAVTCGTATCNSGPSATCLDASRLQTYARSGTCVANACSYQGIVMSCSNGCFNGACIAGSWTRETNPLAAAAPLTKVQMVIDAAGQVHEVGCSVASASSTADNVVYRRRSDIGWQDEQIDTGLGAGCAVAIALDGNGIPAVVYTDSVNHDLRFAWRLSGAWSVKELVATTGNVGYGPSLTFDATGQAVAGYWGVNGGVEDLRVSTRSAANTWSMEVAAVGDGYTTDLVSDIRFDAAGHLHVAGGSLLTAAQSAIHAVKLGTWQKDVTLAGFTSHRALGLGSDGVLSFFYYGPNNDSYVRRYTAQGLHDERVSTFSTFEHPLARLDGPLPSLVMGNDAHWSQRINEFWPAAPTPYTQSNFTTVADFSQQPDGRARYLTTTDELITAPGCAAQCSGRTCGDDGCGGSCGACNHAYCAPSGTCSAWRSEELSAPVSVSVDAVGMAVGSAEVSAFVVSRVPTPMVTVTSRTSAWGLPATVGGQIVFGARGVAASPSGAPIFAYYGSGVAGVYHLESTGWVATALGSVPSERPALEVDSAGTWHLAWTSGSKVVYSRYAGGTWTHTTVIDYSAHQGWQANAPSLAIDGAGHAHVLWVYNANSTTLSHQLHYGNNIGGAFTDDTVVPAITDAGSYWSAPQIRVDAAGTRHVLWADDATTVWYASRAAAAASFSKESVPASYLGAAPSLISFALDAAGVPAIILGRGSPTNDTILYKRTGSMIWTPDTLPTFGAAAVPVVTFDSLNKAHALYWDSGQLRYATKP